MNEDLIRRFHYVGHRFWDWAYIKFKEDLQQEAWLCALLYKDVAVENYLKLCNRHIRKLLKSFGYVESKNYFICSDYYKNDLKSEGESLIDEIEIKRIEHFYKVKHFDYAKICEFYQIWDLQQRILIRSLLRKCFKRECPKLSRRRKR